MNLANFLLSDDFIAIEVEGSYYDLHNNFDFVGVSYNVPSNIVVLSWVKATGSWVPENSPNELELVFSGVTVFKCKERDSDAPQSENNCLDSLGFIGNDLIDQVDGFASNKSTVDACHLNFTFSSGFAIKIGSESAKCRVQ